MILPGDECKSYEKIAEISANKTVDTFTQDTTYHRYMCNKTLTGVTGSLLRKIDDVYIEIIGLTANNINHGFTHFRISDTTPNSGGQRFFADNRTLPAYGINGYYRYQMTITNNAENVDISFQVGESLYSLTNGIKLIFYKKR